MKLSSAITMYDENEITQIYSDGESYDYIVTTEKDIVKINRKNERLLVLKMGFEIRPDTISSVQEQ